ncbi:MAG TPA: enoyl-ACP reductase FabV [Clostridia bacterium]|nr:enoyl-ACP reductase FabV [Clostridia bacterium]
MIVKPKTRGFICTTAHPQGCELHVREQIDYVRKQGHIEGPQKVLVIGSSTGYGLASMITAAFGADADTIGVFFERPASDNRTATAGWYNIAAFSRMAGEAGKYTRLINGDAFSNQIKEQTIELIKKDMGKVDLVVYSLASPRRTHPVTGESFSSVIKPIGKPYTNKTVDFHTGEVSEITIQPASEDETRQTIAVMGGEDWEMWMQALNDAGVLANGVTTVAYSYIGPDITHAVYKEGTIGKAKENLEQSAKIITGRLKELGARAFISVNKALVTQSSSAIPVVPLYISLLYKVMKEKGTHEGCIEQMYRLFADRLYSDSTPLDDTGRIRIDDLEMTGDVQEEVSALWREVNSENIDAISDIKGYREDFFKLFGFGFEGLDYDADTDVNIAISGIV